VLELLLDLLDRESSSRFTDRYLGLPVDLSHAVSACSARTISIWSPTSCRSDRGHRVPGYSEDEKIEIARRFLVPRQLADHGLAARPSLSEATLRAIVRHYTLEAGVRGLSRQIATVCRKIAPRAGTGDTRRHVVDAGESRGIPRHQIYSQEAPEKDDEVGVATGLAWTARR
jgi:ATP-dependent Lon protease